jgi:hypothetical protein
LISVADKGAHYCSINNMPRGQAGRCNPLPGQLPASRSGANMHINARTGIHVASTGTQPHGGRRRASTLSCSFGQLSLTMQAACEPCNIRFVLKYGVGALVNHAFYKLCTWFYKMV